MDAVILAGGNGTRIRSVWEGPKCLVPISGTPILGHLIEKLNSLFQPPSKIILVLGYKSAYVLDWLSRTKWHTLQSQIDKVEVCVEKETKGTANALRYITSKLATSVIILNGDTLPWYSLETLLEAYKNTDTSFLKVPGVAAWHNGAYAGICVVPKMDAINLGKASSLDFYTEKMHRYEVTEGYLDIGTLENFYKAQTITILKESP